MGSKMLEQIRRLRGGDARWMWKDASILAVGFEVDRNAASAWLPTGLRLAKPARSTVFIASYGETSLGVAYHETGVLIHAELAGEQVIHCPWMLVDDDRPLILGREILGYPKKLGTISLDVQPNSVRASVERKGVKLIEMSGELGLADPEAPPLLGGTAVNVWGLVGLSIPKLIRFRFEERIHLARHARVTAEIRGGEHDPLDQLQLGRVIHARLYRTSFRLGRGLPLPVLPVRPQFLFEHWALRYW